MHHKKLSTLLVGLILSSYTLSHSNQEAGEINISKEELIRKLKDQEDEHKKKYQKNRRALAQKWLKKTGSNLFGSKEGKETSQREYEEAKKSLDNEKSEMTELKAYRLGQEIRAAGGLSSHRLGVKSTIEANNMFNKEVINRRSNLDIAKDISPHRTIKGIYNHIKLRKEGQQGFGNKLLAGVEGARIGASLEGSKMLRATRTLASRGFKGITSPFRKSKKNVGGNSQESEALTNAPATSSDQHAGHNGTPPTRPHKPQELTDQYMSNLTPPARPNKPQAVVDEYMSNHTPPARPHKPQAVVDEYMSNHTPPARPHKPQAVVDEYMNNHTIPARPHKPQELTDQYTHSLTPPQLPSRANKPTLTGNPTPGGSNLPQGGADQ